MNIIIMFASAEGQTRKFSLFMRDSLERAGRNAKLIEANVDISVGPASFDRAMIAASLPVGRYLKPVIDFAANHHAALIQINAVFVSVSLSVAGKDLEDADGLAACVAASTREPGWRPDRAEHIADAFRFSTYGILKRWAMKSIAWCKSQSTEPSLDHELTDWAALTRFTDLIVQQQAPAPYRTA
jgi:menaquinone-dependent protoporphyrinogen oxidase